MRYRAFLLPIFMLSFVVVPRSLQAQRQYETWYFGQNAGLSFAGGNPVPLLNGRVNTLDGSAVISRPATGELLFYSDGKTVWNATHTPMPNGTGLAGHESSGQPALIVPDPGDTNQFYLFTTGAANTSSTATRYSIVDIRRDGGKGDVIVKNTLLLERGTEKITATRHCNGKDYWVITHAWGSNTFHVYLLTAQGISDSVITSIGITYPSAADIQGTFQMSSDGRLLAVTSPQPKTVELFNFDNSTGVISNQQLIGQGDLSYYGQEFSPDNSKLYVNTLPQGTNPADLFQFDLSAGTTAAIRASRFTLIHLSERLWQGGQLQRGGDDKIYVSWYSRDSLGVIENPNVLGVGATYRHSGLWLGGARTNYGLPNIIDSDIGYVPGSEEPLSVNLSISPANAKPGDLVDLIVILCNSSTTDLANITLDLQIPSQLGVVSGNAGTFAVAKVPAGLCDTFVVASARLSGSVTTGSVLTSCLQFITASPVPCLIPDSSCASLTVAEIPVDTSQVDYTFHFLSGCPGTFSEEGVLFNSHRYTDTIIDVRFTGSQANQFAYGGTLPVQLVIRPTQDQMIPIQIRRRTPGPLTAIMVLATKRGDTFRIRLQTNVTASLSPFLNLSEIRTGNRAGRIDTCVRVTNILTQKVGIVDTAWFRGGSGTTLISPTLPISIDPGESIDLCFTILTAQGGRGDTLVIGGSEYVDFCPHCFNHTIIINDKIPGPGSLSSVDLSDNAGTSAALQLFPNPAQDIAYARVVLTGKSTLTLTIIDMLGNVVREHSVREVFTGENLLAVDVSDIPSGQYALQIVTGKRTLTSIITIIR
ncbi:MAG: T9SS type A sorting domain-containing protein [Ignavibacteriae bacterium]|nr:T9SS type A sorting domain-containing protein [Ignavibacteriota bacterium]MCB9214896.1 T9SS type A sorting domain-containing protein [Ignavibacteria bacterium]